MLLATIAKYISPEFIWIVAFFGLGFPFLYLINLAFLFYWVIQFRQTFIFSAITLIISTSTALNYFQLNFNNKNNNTKNFKISSYNTMLFDLYNWKKNKQTRDLIFTDLADISSDIICFQEYYTSEEVGDFNNTDSLTKLLNLPYNHIEYTATLRENDHWGIATFSKYPIINKGKIIFNTRTNNLCIYSDIVIHQDTLRVYNLHLQSISFSKKDNVFLNDFKNGNESDEDLEKGKSILRRIKRAFVKRAKQVEMVTTHMQTSKYKIILCGDFNDTPASFSYHKLSESLHDAFVEKGKGFGRTYAGEWPQFRIDYILYDKKLNCVKFERAEETYTDHYPISAQIQY